MASRRCWCRAAIIGPDGTVIATAKLSGPGAPGMLATDGVARLALVAVRLGARLVLSEMDPRLEELVDLVGLPVEKSPGPLPGGPAEPEG